MEPKMEQPKQYTPEDMVESGKAPVELTLKKIYIIIKTIVVLGFIIFISFVMSAFSTDSGDTRWVIPAFLLPFVILTFPIYGNRLFKEGKKSKIFRLIRGIIIGVLTLSIIGPYLFIMVQQIFSDNIEIPEKSQTGQHIIW